MRDTEHPRPSGALTNLLAMGLGFAAVYLAALALPHLPCWGLLPVVALLAWPVWQYQQEVALFQRRAILDRIATGDGAFRRWFWAGTLTRILQVFVALVLALLLVGAAAQLNDLQWLVLGADLLVLVLLLAIARWMLARQIDQDHLDLIARRWPLMFINLALLVTAFVVIDFFLLGVPDTRNLSWHQVAEQGFAEGSHGALCPIAGWLSGALTSLDRLTWHALEVLIPALPDQELKWLAWAAALFQAGIVAYVFSRLILGALSLVETRDKALEAVVGRGAFSKAFVLTILLLAIPYLYALVKLQEFDPTVLGRGAEQLLDWTNPCRAQPLSADDADALQSELDTDLQSARAASVERAEQRVDELVNDLFDDVEAGVDKYLDWYFTVIGEYERLAAFATGGFADLMTNQLEEHLFGESGFADVLESANARIAEQAESDLTAFAATLGSKVRDDPNIGPCGIEAMDLSALGNLDRDKLRAGASAGVGAAAGALTAKALAKKTSAAMMTKMATKKGFQAAAAVAGKTAAKKGGTVLLSAAGAAALCSPGGPLAAVCGVVAGAAAWLAVDKAFVEIDEYRFRDQMRAEILEAIAEQNSGLSEALKAGHRARIDAISNQIHSSIQRTFLPVKDGT